jgi:hypothetical protein
VQSLFDAKREIKKLSISLHANTDGSKRHRVQPTTC